MLGKNYKEWYEQKYVRLNENYKAIITLDSILTNNNIPHELSRCFNGWKIAYPNNEKCVFDVIEHSGSYGNTEDLMEAYGDGIEDVEGFMDIETALSHFQRVHNIYKDDFIESEE